MLDGDEVARIDRAVLDRLDPETRAVRLRPLEAVSRLHPDGDPTLFKRRLDRGRAVTCCTSLGVIAKPNERSYFRGHICREARTSGRRSTSPSASTTSSTRPAANRVDARTKPRAAGSSTTSRTTATSSSASGRRCSGRVAYRSSQRGRRSTVAAAIRALLERARGGGDRAFLDQLYERLGVDDVDLLQQARPPRRGRPGRPARTVRDVLARGRPAAAHPPGPGPRRPQARVPAQARRAADIDQVVAGLQRGL